VLRRGDRADARTGTPADLLVVGLGNPGEEYRHTRHNAGADVVEILAARHGERLKGGKFSSLVAEANVRGKRLALAIPLTYMNESGNAVAPLARRFGVAADQIVVVHDELDLEPGVLKVKAGGGLAGNNGLRSIKAHLKTDEFLRVRVGIGKPRSKEQGADHVLSRMGKKARAEFEVTLEEAADAVETILAEGVEVAMNRYNTRR
jgi:PTH1 family peptidyl-tRNA hydrolase